VNFDEALQYLLSLGHETLAMKLGLRNTELLLESLGHPHYSYPSVQIAGTNGKGSTAIMLDSICRAGGIRTGLYTSPHLISITERIKIDGNEISTAEFAELATEVRLAADLLLTENKIEALPTFFEHVTAIALLAFKQAGVQLAILETGLGGRLDATTVAGAATVAITPVAMDHEEYLGSSLSEIASEKAAIIRPGVNAIIGKQAPGVLEVILNRSVDVGVVPDTGVPAAEVEGATNDGRYTVTLKTPHNEYEHLTIGLRGSHQIENASLAIRIAESLRPQGLTISKTAIMEGIETATYSGRLELVNGAPPVLLDGAHNPAGAEALRQYLDEHVDVPITLVFGAMKDKKLADIAQLLFPRATQLIITAPQNPRAAEPEHLRKLAMDHLSPAKIHVAVPSGAAMSKAKELTPYEGLICVTGSLYLVGEFKAGLDEHA
jgi:dihydrofolate synthase / folylpolyglutamate synthase